MKEAGTPSCSTSKVAGVRDLDIKLQQIVTNVGDENEKSNWQLRFVETKTVGVCQAGTCQAATSMRGQNWPRLGNDFASFVSSRNSHLIVRKS